MVEINKISLSPTAQSLAKGPGSVSNAEFFIQVDRRAPSLGNLKNRISFNREELQQFFAAQTTIVRKCNSNQHKHINLKVIEIICGRKWRNENNCLSTTFQLQLIRVAAVRAE